MQRGRATIDFQQAGKDLAYLERFNRIHLSGAARMLGFSPPTFWKYAEEGRFETLRINDRLYITASEFDKLRRAQLQSSEGDQQASQSATDVVEEEPPSSSSSLFNCLD